MKVFYIIKQSFFCIFRIILLSFRLQNTSLAEQSLLIEPASPEVLVGVLRYHVAQQYECE